MDITAQKIIASIEEKHPPEQPLILRNVLDLNIEAMYSNAYQHIIGITKADSFGGVVTIDSYKRKMTSLMGQGGLRCECYGWPFKGYELEDAKKIVEELSDYYKIEMNINKMFRANDIRNDDEYWYIVITVVTIPNFYISYE